MSTLSGIRDLSDAQAADRHRRFTRQRRYSQRAAALGGSRASCRRLPSSGVMLANIGDSCLNWRRTQQTGRLPSMRKSVSLVSASCDAVGRSVRHCGRRTWNRRLHRDCAGTVLVCLALLGVPVCLTEAAAGEVPSRSSLSWVESSLGSVGAKATVAELDRDQGEGGWNDLIGHIRNGEGSWIGLAPVLAKAVSNTGPTYNTDYDLSAALADALQKNAPAVLRVLAADPDGVGRDLPVICRGVYPYVIKALPAAAMNYGKRSLAAVTAVSDPGLRRVRAACLAELARHQAHWVAG
jgi:hypothetical protein